MIVVRGDNAELRVSINRQFPALLALPEASPDLA